MLEINKTLEIATPEQLFYLTDEKKYLAYCLKVEMNKLLLLPLNKILCGI